MMALFDAIAAENFDELNDSDSYELSNLQVAKKRNRNVLLDTPQQEKYAAISQKNGGLQISKAVKTTAEIIIRKFIRAKNASIAAATTWEQPRNIEPIDAFPAFEELIGDYADYYRDRRICIKYLYIAIFGAPPEEMWKEMRLVLGICGILDIKYDNSHTAVRNVLLEIVQNLQHYDGRINHGGGRKAIIEHGTVQAEIVYKGLQQNLTARDVTCVINMFRTEIEEHLISRSAIQAFIAKSECIKTRKRQLKKSGRDDPDCNWARCRLAQANQWKEQFRLGELPPDHPDLINPIFPPLYLDGIIFWDEHHRQVILGNANIYQHQVSIGGDGIVASPADGIEAQSFLK